MKKSVAFCETRLSKFCTKCGHYHSTKVRQAFLERALSDDLSTMAPADMADLRATWPCFYPEGDTGYARFHRDIVAIRKRRAQCSP